MQMFMFSYHNTESDPTREENCLMGRLVGSLDRKILSFEIHGFSVLPLACQHIDKEMHVQHWLFV